LTANRLPNLIIAGTVKGGTTSLFSYLVKHPDICGSFKKETCYFLPIRYEEMMGHIDQYQKYFEHCSHEKYVLEATPGYFEGGMAVAQNIKKKLGDIKIIITIRNPIDRLISFYNYKKTHLELDASLSFVEYVRICEQMPFSEKKKRANDSYWGIDGGFYSKYLPQWFEIFGESVRVVFFDDIRNDPRELLNDLCKWLKIDPLVIDPTELTIENKTVYYKNEFLHKAALTVNTAYERFFRSHPQLKYFLRNLYYSINGKSKKERVSEKIINYLNTVYKPYNDDLFEYLSRYGYLEMPEWLTKTYTLSCHH
jgi:hypothetical protein